MKRISIITAIFLFSIAIFTGGVFYKKSLYELVEPKRGRIFEAIYGLGKVKSNKRYEVKVGVMTSVEKIYADERDFVKKGGNLIKFRESAIFKAPFSGKITRVVHHEKETVLPQVMVLKLEDLKERHIEVSLEQNGALRVKEGQL